MASNGEFLLGEAIKDLRDHFKAGDNLFNRFVENLEKVRADLRRTSVLSIHDPEKGGVLRGNYQNRSYEIRALDGAVEWIACPKKQMVYNKGNLPSEVAFCRGIFNLQHRTLTVHGQSFKYEVRLVAYEAPLLRKKYAQVKDGPVSDRAMRCDLVGIVGNELWAIETKTNVSETTDVAYGMLEAFAYGYLLQQHKKYKNEFAEELSLCYRHFHPDVCPPKKVEKVRAFLAAPASYYREYLGLGSKMTPEKARRRLLEAKIVNLMIDYSRKKEPQFGGFIVFDHEPTDLVGRAIEGDDDLIIPIFNRPLQQVELYPNTFELEKSLLE